MLSGLAPESNRLSNSHIKEPTSLDRLGNTMKLLSVYHGFGRVHQSHHDGFRPNPVQIAEFALHRRYRWEKPRLPVPVFPKRRTK